jgi:hypothetical protein
MKILQSEYYGDTTRWFIGKAKTTTLDPLGLGRIRVRVFGLHTENTNDIEDKDLPWAPVAMATNIPSGNGIYQTFGINDNDTVFGIFLDGKHSQNPLVLGVIPHAGEIQNQFTNVPIDPTIPFTTNINPNGNLKQTETINNSNIELDNIPGKIIDEELDISTFTENGVIQETELSTEDGDNFTKIAFDFFNQELSNYGSRNPAEQAAGLVGNFIAESSMNPTAKSPAPENSRGIAQWNASANRLGKLIDFASVKGVDPYTLDVQLQYTMFELKNDDIVIASRVGVITIDSLIEKDTVENATRHILDIYENPKVALDYYAFNENSVPSDIRKKYEAELDKRIGYALDVYNAFTKGE